MNPTDKSNDQTEQPHDLTGIYPTPTKQSYAPLGSTSSATPYSPPSNEGEKPNGTLRLLVTLLGVFIILSPVASSLLGALLLSTSISAFIQYPQVLFILLADPFVLIPLVLNLVVGIGIILRKNIARIGLIIVIALTTLKSLYDVTVLTMLVGSRVDQLFVQPIGQRFLGYFILGLVINIAILVFITRPSVKKQFS